MSDPKITHQLPSRYRRTFFEERTRAEDRVRWYFKWVCRQCGQKLQPNTAGAQAHVAKHLREAESRSALDCRAAPDKWCDVCESWRYTQPCGRDDCPAMTLATRPEGKGATG